MTQVQIAEIIIGLILLVGGAWKAWQTWQRLRELQGRVANLRRYDAWRGGRQAVPDGPSEAEIEATDLRRGIGIWGSLAVIGIMLLVLALLAR
ncbi:MAG TPA: hypothetical protein VFW92_09010 [Candidatus Limnocylindrales bacterium]|nr:hypothetical protein [Candidatus Limnocylindrales bacterium]